MTIAGKFCIFLAFISHTECAKILGLFCVPGVSHYRGGVALMKIFAEYGHEVTVVGPFGETNPPPNYRSVVLDGLFEEEKMGQMFAAAAKEQLWLQKLWQQFTVASKLNPFLEKTFNHTNFRKIMESNEKYDLIILEDFFSPALRYAAVKLGAPLIVFSPLDMNDYVDIFQGVPRDPATTTLLSNSPAHSFFNRLANSVQFLVSRLACFLVTLPSQNKILHKYYPDAPKIEEFVYDASLAFVNSDVSIYGAAPSIPNLINIGGYHIKEPQPLPEDLQNLIDKAENGVIYFSLGSNFKSKFLPKERKEMFLRVFSKLKETVFWKLEEDLPNIPSNVVVRKWFPQNDILAHRNVKLFMTHGGIFSIMEAVYHGVPLLAFPIFGDQPGNAQRAEAAGYAKWLTIDKFKEDELEAALEELLSNEKYLTAAEHTSDIFRDKPYSREEEIVFWAEYVIRHEGAKYLRTPQLKLTWYQRNLWDIYAFLAICLILFVLLLRIFLQIIVKRLRSRKNKTKLN